MIPSIQSGIGVLYLPDCTNSTTFGEFKLSAQRPQPVLLFICYSQYDDHKDAKDTFVFDLKKLNLVGVMYERTGAANIDYHKKPEEHSDGSIRMIKLVSSQDFYGRASSPGDEIPSFTSWH
jgi:hypothetical protein